MPRLDAPGVLHHVMGRGIERRKIFLSDTLKKVLICYKLYTNNCTLPRQSFDIKLIHSLYQVFFNYIIACLNPLPFHKTYDASTQSRYLFRHIELFTKPAK